MTAEHIYPLWTRDVVLPSTSTESGYIFGSEEQRYVVPDMPLAAITVKKVCTGCNNGWLSALEERAKSLLTRPIQGDPTTFYFADVFTVANWAYKTCILFDLAATNLLGPLGFHWLYQRRCPPPGTVVTMAAYGSARFPQYGSSSPVHYTVETRGQRFDLNGYLLTISIGHLVFQVFGHHIDRVVDLIPRDWKRDYCKVVWPAPGAVRWPPLRSLNDEQLFRFAGSEMPDAKQRQRKMETSGTT